MDEMNESVEPAAGTEPKSSVSRAKIFWLNMAISIPAAVAIAGGILFALEAIGWNAPVPIIGFICGFGTSEIMRVLLVRYFEKRERSADV